jgi:drug/metabolite transporter (DMT)-like permease
MVTAVGLALVASLFTATSSVCQRLGARDVAFDGGFGPRLLFRLVRRPIWLAGVVSMIIGFVCQVAALRHGELALVQPILATELLFVFAFLAVVGTRTVRTRDWLSAAAMAVGLGTFLFVADPSGGHPGASGTAWVLSAVSAMGLAVVCSAVAFVPLRGHAPSPSRRAATLGVATGISWGFVAAVIKELSRHLGHGIGALASTWSPYVLIGVGAVSMMAASHALQAGPLAASQPGFTIADPLIASLLGFFLFHEHLRVGVGDLAGEALAGALLLAGVIGLSHSHLVADTETPIPVSAQPRAVRP